MEFRRGFDRSWLSCAALVLAALLTTPGLAQTKKFSLVTATDPPLTQSATHPGFLNVLAHAVFRRVDLEVDITPVPAERALINVNSGLDDGDIFRAANVEKSYPNLVRVPEAVLNYDFMAYTLRPDIRIRSWADLQPYAVAYPSGWKIYELNVKNVKELTVTPSVHELIPLLEKGRVDVILADRWGTRWDMRQSSSKLKFLEQPLAHVEMFMFFNKKHAALAPMVAQALKDMKADGSYKKIYDATLKPLETR